MSNPMEKMMQDMFGNIAKGGMEEGMKKFLKNLQEEVGAPDGMELPEIIEVEYTNGEKETFSTKDEK